MTKGGKYINSLDLLGKSTTITEKEADAIWLTASKMFASGSQGRNVSAFTKKYSFRCN
jgi:hypothetical protein